ncbi:hypothetical protein K458DRAFT_402279 [Lentithecium fluviatile CBS 122367]|uniref:Uncharacterized protein n=1 Tax=Lentithecium fluviatile CBS 122367 TaxID=1168545 RepID=A0A6G1J862_9PLEO|nr:hypothetical protein K458DRAFT_402279 [Lentithecium fluviatile CBS 122367]
MLIFTSAHGIRDNSRRAPFLLRATSASRERLSKKVILKFGSASQCHGNRFRSLPFAYHVFPRDEPASGPPHTLQSLKRRTSGSVVLDAGTAPVPAEQRAHLLEPSQPDHRGSGSTMRVTGLVVPWLTGLACSSQTSEAVMACNVSSEARHDTTLTFATTPPSVRSVRRIPFNRSAGGSRLAVPEKAAV